MQQPETSYVRSGEAFVAYQVFGEGPLVIVIVPGRISNLELVWDDPDRSAFYRALAEFARVVVLDRRGVGASDRLVGVPTLEQQVDDLRVVMDAAGVERACFYGAFEAAALTAMFAGTYPGRVAALLLWQPRARGGWAPDYTWGSREPETPWGGSKYTSPEHIDTLIRTQWPSRVGNPEFRRRVVRMYRLSASPSSFAAAHRTWFDIDVRHILGAVQAPTLVMHGALGDANESRYVVERVPGATFAELPENEFVPFYGDVDRAVHVIHDFIRGAWDDMEQRATVARVLATVLFTDLVGSTELATTLGPRWQEVLHEHNAAIRKEIAHFRGREIDATGDGFFASGFDGPASAIRCGCAIHEVMRPLGLQVRVGVHTGECDLVDGKLAGLAVAIGARVAAQASGGEVLVSGTVRDLVAGSGIDFEPRGLQELKGAGRWPLYAVATH